MDERAFQIAFRILNPVIFYFALLMLTSAYWAYGTQYTGLDMEESMNYFVLFFNSYIFTKMLETFRSFILSLGKRT